jgi:site-specific DNA recombinase
MEVAPIQKRAAIYGRVSTSSQEKENTIATQVDVDKELIVKNGMVLVKEYLDEGWSGDILVRPALDQLRADATLGLWDVVVIYDPDRIARRYSYQEIVIDELKARKIEVIFVTISPVKSEEDQLMFGVRGVFAQYEKMKITERFRIGRVRKARENKLVVSRPTYGYNLIKRVGKRGDSAFCDTHYTINEAEAKIVRIIYRWVADEQLTIRKVVMRLWEMQIMPQRNKQGKWNTSTLGTLLRNRTYIGEAHYAASYAVEPVRPLKKEEYGR